MRINLQPAYVLHSRPYRDSSLLLETFTAEQGRLAIVARGARRRARGGSGAALLQLFTPLLLSFSGKSELKTLTGMEPVGSALALRGDRLYSGMYLNELLVRLLHRHDPHPKLFAAYNEALAGLVGASQSEDVLRSFELILLGEMGYSLDLKSDGRTGEPVRADGVYQYEAEYGMVELCEGKISPDDTYAGEALLAMAAGQFGGIARTASKRLLRKALAVQLGGAPLRSRDLFQRAGSS